MAKAPKKKTIVTKGGMGSKGRSTGTTASKVKADGRNIAKPDGRNIAKSSTPDRVSSWTDKLPFIGPVKPERAGKSKYKETANAILSAILDKKKK